MNSQQVISEIRNAFKDTPYPIGYIGRDNYEGEELWKPLVNKHWSDVSLELVRRYRNELPMLYDEGFRFYLPAFMLAILLHPREVDTLHASLILSLTPPDFRNQQLKSSPHASENTLRVFRRGANAFSQQEIIAIVTFLQFYKQEYSEEYLVSELRLVDGALDFWQGI
jgi:hypothetical protein